MTRVSITNTVPVDLVGGPYDGHQGELRLVNGQPQPTLSFLDGAFTYVLDKRPRKLHRRNDELARVESVEGLLYRYDATSPGTRERIITRPGELGRQE